MVAVEMADQHGRMSFGSMPIWRIATIDEAPQSTRTLPARPLQKAGVEPAAAAESVAGAEELQAHCASATGGGGACSRLETSLVSVVRRMSRGLTRRSGGARCMVERLSHITRSSTRHSWG